MSTINKRKAILIGFEYSNHYNDNKSIYISKHLPGIIIDLYLCYTFLKRNGWKDEEIQIITDIKNDHPTSLLRKSIIEKIVPADILSFITYCKEKEILREYKDDFLSFFDKSHSDSSVNFKENYLNNSKRVIDDLKTDYLNKSHSDSSIVSFRNYLDIQKTEQIFIYYTGHMKDKNLILPNNRSMRSSNLIKHLSFNSKQTKEIFIIMDCCESDLELPFILKNGIYRLNSFLNNFYKDKIVCISSSLPNENSVTYKTGSRFSKNIFKMLDENNKLPLNLFLDKIKIDSDDNKQTSNITSSYPIYYLFGWLFSYPNIHLRLIDEYIEIDS